MFALLLGKEGADAYCSPTENGNSEGNLDFVAWIDKPSIIDSPDRQIRSDQLLLIKVELLLFIIHNQAFFSQGIPRPLMKFILAMRV